MMAKWFLIIIYLSFISLGIPDSLLGSAWPVMWTELGASFGSAGIVSMVVAGGTIVSSLVSGSIIERIGTGKITLVSCFLTAGALLGFSFAPSLFWLVLLAIPLGLGGGAVDAALNQYVATHYKAHHMSWLHCFWGVGATMGPIIMSLNFELQLMEEWLHSRIHDPVESCYYFAHYTTIMETCCRGTKSHNRNPIRRLTERSQYCTS